MILISMVLGHSRWRAFATTLLTIGACLSTLANAQSPTKNSIPKYDSPMIRRLSLALRDKGRTALDGFWSHATVPLIEPIKGENQFRWITFFWHGDATTREVSVGSGDIPTPDPSKWTFKRLGNTDLWFKTDRVPRDARFTYLLQVNDEPLQRDPLNQRQFGGRSVVELPDAPPQPWIADRPGVPRGQLVHRTLRSQILQEDRAIGIYTPAGYSRQGKPTSLLIVLDGEIYGDANDALVPTPRVLDNLIAAHRIPPTMAVLVDNMSQKLRNRDLRCSTAFERFISQEVLPWVRTHYRVSSKPSDVVITGSSDGGLFAIFAGLHDPEAFGNVLAQSSNLFYSPTDEPTLDAYTRDGGWLTRQFVTKPRLSLRFFLDVGILEAGVTNPVFEHRRLSDVLEAKGYAVTYVEFSGGHDYIDWRNLLGEGLIAVLGSSRSSL